MKNKSKENDQNKDVTPILTTPNEVRSNKIITITLNPSLDRTLVIQYLHEGYQNHTTEPSRLDPAGTGLNISRAIHKLNAETHALVLLGNDATAKAYRSLLEDESFPFSVINVEGKTRSSTVILDTANNKETSLTENADNITREDVSHVIDLLRNGINPGDVIVLAGTLPISLSTDIYSWLTEEAHNLDAEVVLATSGEPLRKALPAAPDLVILQKEELESFFNIPVRDVRDIVSCAQQMQGLGATGILITMPSISKAFLFTDQGHFIVDFEEISLGTSSGVWEALLAGFLVGQYRQENLTESLEMGAAAALFASDQVGSEFGDEDEVKEYLRNVGIAQEIDLQNSNEDED